MDSSNFFAELKRRNVYKVAIAYIVAGWALSQGIAQVFPVFDIPNWAIRLIVLLIILGLPIAVVLTWMFELTPQGIRHTETADAMPVGAKPKKYVWIYVVVIGAAVSIGLFFLGRYSAATRQSQSPNNAEKSIAVLPLGNLSRDPDNEYFAAGIQDEIITRLAQISDLKVISCSSTQRYKGSRESLRQIASELGVTNILEGSVQKASDQVHVNVQLLNAVTDSHLWADTFDRKLTDVFGVEAEIAKTIADTLQAKLSGAERSAIAARPTENSEAHEFYLRGRYFVGKRGADNLKRAIDYFNQAIAKDPNYALAYAGLADSYALLPEWSTESPAEYLPKAKAAANKALALDNTLAEAHTSLAFLLFKSDGNLGESKREFERAIALNPNYAFAHYLFGFDVLLPLGEFDKAIAEVNRAIELDPFSVIFNANFGFCYVDARRYPEAIAQFRKAAELDPSLPLPHIGLAVAHELCGQREQAIIEYQKASDLGQHTDTPADWTDLLAHSYALKGERAKALQLLDQFKALEQRGEAQAFLVALIYVDLGDKNEAIEWLQRSYQNKEFNFIASINVNPMLDPLRGDPRFEALVKKVIGTVK